MILFNTLTVSAQQPDWFIKLKKLQKSFPTEKDIEKVFGSLEIIYSTPLKEIKSRKSWTKIIKYKIPEGSFDVFLSAGRCSSENTDGFDLDDGVMLTYSFTLGNPVDVSLLKLNLNGFKASREDDVEIWFFTNEKKGITYEISDKKLRRISYSLPKKYYQLCKDKL